MEEIDMNSAYLEIGNKCFCKCIMCNTWKQKQNKIGLDVILYRVIRLKILGFEQIRLAGNDPLSYPHFSLILKYLAIHKLHSDVTTTLLGGPIKELAKVDILRVSLLGVYDKYKLFFNVDKFELFCSNLKYLQTKRYLPIIINYTFVNIDNKCNFTYEDAILLNKFVKEHTPLAIIHFFPAIRYYGEWTLKEKMEIDMFLNALDFKYKFFGFDLKKMESCTVAGRRLYVQLNGDCYPCCLQGGEIGQESQNETYLGNIDDNTLELKELKNLNNYICRCCTQKYFKLMKGKGNGKN